MTEEIRRCTTEFARGTREYILRGPICNQPIKRKGSKSCADCANKKPHVARRQQPVLLKREVRP